MIVTDVYEQLTSPERHEQFKRSVEQGGYASFRTVVTQLEAAVKQSDEDHFSEVEQQILTAEALFPEPVRFSPAWQSIWKELLARLHWKRHAYESVPASERAGEWQIILDNPYTNQEIVCYPGLTFKEAAFLFGYFKPTLSKNEYIRIQKVVNSLTMTGDGKSLM